MATDLLGDPVDPPHPARASSWTPCGWILGRAARWRHYTGAVVAHCGHPTANRPYHVPAQPELGCFYNLIDAQLAALGHENPDRRAARLASTP